MKSVLSTLLLVLLAPCFGYSLDTEINANIELSTQAEYNSVDPASITLAQQVFSDGGERYLATMLYKDAVPDRNEVCIGCDEIYIRILDNAHSSYDYYKISNIDGLTSFSYRRGAFVFDLWELTAFQQEDGKWSRKILKSTFTIEKK